MNDLTGATLSKRPAYGRLDSSFFSVSVLYLRCFQSATLTPRSWVESYAQKAKAPFALMARSSSSPLVVLTASHNKPVEAQSSLSLPFQSVFSNRIDFKNYQPVVFQSTHQ